METLLEGVKVFHESYYKPQQELFEKLSNGQQPTALFITCSDSRIDPGLLTQTRPGNLFVLRNAGNIVPPYEAGGGESATIEYAISVLNIRDIIICGHTNCGAMKAILHRESVRALPAVAAWLEQAGLQSGTVPLDQPFTDETESLDVIIERNVLAQFRNLSTHPAVAAGLAEKRLRLHGWVYRIGQGDVVVYSRRHSRFVPALGDEAALSKNDQQLELADTVMSSN